MKIVLIGNGKWGRNYIHNFNTYLPDIELVIANKENWRDFKCDGVIISTPPSSHIEIAEHFLKKQTPVMIEKPLSFTYQQALKLQQYNIPILVNHIHLFSDSYREIKRIFDKDKVISILSNGFNNGPVRNYSSLFDYGVHDLSIILDLVESYPIRINSKIVIRIEDRKLYQIDLDFDNFSSTSIVGNAGASSQRDLLIKYKEINISYQDTKNQNILLSAILVFLQAINGKLDSRLGIELSLQISKIIEICHQQCGEN